MNNKEKLFGLIESLTEEECKNLLDNMILFSDIIQSKDKLEKLKIFLQET